MGIIDNNQKLKDLVNEFSENCYWKKQILWTWGLI